MRTFHAEPQILRDMLDEGEVIAEQQHPDFKASAIRHPTLGKVVIVQGRDGSGVIVETEE
jgi:hypothetical protein